MIEAQLTLTERDISALTGLETPPLETKTLAREIGNVGKGFDTSENAPLALFTVSDELLYAGSIHPELRIIAPFEVHFEQVKGGYTAVVHELDEYGLGDTRSEALEDLRKTLQELYLSLERDQVRLSSDLVSVWARLRSHVTRIRR